MPHIPLIEPMEKPSLLSVEVPTEFYWVLNSPAPLAGMRYPRADFPWTAMAAAGFSGLVCLEPGNYSHAPLDRLFSDLLEDLHHGRDPRDPRREQQLIREAVDTVVTAVRSGRGVIVHCVGGTGRTGTIIGCVLRRLGYDAREVVTYLDRLHKARGRRGWPESPWQKTIVESVHV